MKRFALILLVLALISGQSFAASSMVASRQAGSTDDVLVIKVACIAHTDGTFDDKQITAAEIGFDYWLRGYKIDHASAVNPTTGYATTAATVTVADETGQQLIGSVAGDTLTLSTAAYNAATGAGVAYLVIDRGGGQRPVTSKLTVKISDTGSAANTLSLYLWLRRPPITKN